MAAWFDLAVAFLHLVSGTRQAVDDNWDTGGVYESYMGRWSRPLALSFVRWLNPSPGARWLDFGCGTGALTSAICALASPLSVLGCDQSESFVAYARGSLVDHRVSFMVGPIDEVVKSRGWVDWIVSGLVLNFLSDPKGILATMQGLARPGGTVGAYVWDYAQGMQFLRFFWDAAVALDPVAAPLDEGKRFPLCDPGRLKALFADVGFQDVVLSPIEVATQFQGFDDFWLPFTKGTGPAPSYVASLSRGKRENLRDHLCKRLKASPGGSIRLTAQAWAIKGTTKKREEAI